MKKRIIITLCVVDWVLQHFAQDPRWRLEGQMGFMAILHTWTQRLKRHFHLHCIVPGGVWVEAAPFNTFYPACGSTTA